MSFKKLRRHHAQRTAQQSIAMAHAIGKTLEAVLTKDRLESLHACLYDIPSGPIKRNLDGLCTDLYRITGLERPAV